MSKQLPVLLTLSLLFSLAPVDKHQIATAQDEQEEAAGPFNENMTWDEAEKLVEKAVEGDEEAYEKVSAGRLAWVPLLTSPRWSWSCARWAHELLAQEDAWLADMQRWEVLLGEADGEAIVAGWKKRKDLFRHAESQLARGIIACGMLGDRASMQALAKVNPDSPWVRAALGWLGELPDAKQCVAAMQPALKLLMETERYTIVVQPGLLDSKVSRKRHGTRDFCELECELFYDAGGITVIHAVPHQWRHMGLVDRLGCRISELPTHEERESAIKATGTYLGEETDTNWGWQTLLAAARSDEVAEGAPVPGAVGQISRGPLLRAYALQNLGEFDTSRRWCAVACFHGQPDWQPAQRWLVNEALQSRDAQFARLAVRAVLGVRDDMLDGIVSVAQELKSGELLAAEAKTFHEVLADSESETLKAVAQALSGKGAFPESKTRKPLGLSIETRAELVAAFADPLELECYGGAAALLWMNRAHFLAGQRRLFDAFEAYDAAIQAAQNGLGRKRGLACSAEAYWSLRLSVPPDELEHLLDRRGKSHSDTVEALRREQALRAETPPGDADEKELARARIEKIAGNSELPMDEELRKIVEDNPSYTGGYALSCLGHRTVEEFDYAARNEYWWRGQRAAPLDLRVWYQGLPTDKPFLRYKYDNWFGLERQVQCLALVRPFELGTYSCMASVAARAGAPAREVTVMLLNAADRALVPFYGGVILQAFRRMLFARGFASLLLNRLLATFGPVMHRGWHGHVNQVLMSVAYGFDSQFGLQLVAMGGQRAEYLLTCADNELRQGNRANDVNTLLNYAIEVVGHSPKTALQYIERAEEIGVSAYGRFVASQMFIRAKACQGDWDAALARYRELRGGEVGYPPYLDDCMLHGLTEGNQYQHIGDLLDEFKKHELDLEGPTVRFSLRRALMAAGRHGSVEKVETPTMPEDSPDGYNFNYYSPLFHEARALLDDGETGELARRAVVYWNEGIEDGIGVQLDAYLLLTLASKLMLNAPKLVDEEGMIRAAHKGVPEYFMPTDNCLETWVFRILAGQNKPDSLPPMSDDYEWHGMVYSERPIAARGCGFLSDDEGVARDHFIRGLLAFFTDDHKTARVELEACVKEDQRCSHEYHVAEWLLDKQIPKKD